MRKLIIILVGLLFFNAVLAQKYHSEDLFIKTADSIKISGTLILPKKKVNHLTLAIIIAGSGPTDRDGNSGLMINNSLKYLAEGLVKHNIASFRYDKRAIGKSLSSSISEIDLRFEDYINDPVALVKYFKVDKRFDKIVIIGHSEGSLLGMIASRKAGVSQFVSISGVGRTADKILEDQLGMQYSKDKTRIILDSLKAGFTVSDLGRLKSLFRPSVQPYMISWFKYQPCYRIWTCD